MMWFASPKFSKPLMSEADPGRGMRMISGKSYDRLVWRMYRSLDDKNLISICVTFPRGTFDDFTSHEIRIQS